MRATISTESQTTVNPALLLEHQDQYQSVSYHDVPASDLVNQNCSEISVPPVSKSEVQVEYTDESEPDSLSQINLEVCSAPLAQVLESQCQQSVNLDPAISDSKDYSAISARVSEVQRDQSVIPSATAYHSWFVKPKRDKQTKYFESHSHQPVKTKFNATNVYFRPDDSGGRLQRLWLSYSEEKKALFTNLCIAYGTTTNRNQNLSKFLTVSIRGNTFINELMNQKVLKNTRLLLKLTYDSAIIKQW